LVGIKVGYKEGDLIGNCVEINPGWKLGKFVLGKLVGILFDGNKLGLGLDGCDVGTTTGFNVGTEIGLLGEFVGDEEL